MDVLDSIIEINNDYLSNKEKEEILERIIDFSRTMQKIVRNKSK